MGLLSNTVSITRYRVEGKLKKPAIKTVAAGLKEHAVPEIEGDVAEKTVGWTSFQSPYRPDFGGSSFVVGAYFVFSLRIDKKTIPPKVLKKHCAIEEAKRLVEAGRPYLSRHEKKMIKEHVRSVLMSRIPAVPHVYDLIWSYEEGFVWFFSTLKSANEDLESLFLKSFQIPLIRIFPYTLADLSMGLSGQQRDTLLQLSATEFVG
ncbi:MAG: recombination-associated protein RdgC [Deltaproteobacteria bacterium]|nr:recombination-associated protein RdgC [Deltaproteobacteria bacterium]